MNAAEVREALHKRWPDGDYVVVEEAPLEASRQGRKIDLVAVSAWRSRGYTVDAVEIKVSMQDWRRELADVAKADGWWHYCDYFWVATPADLAAKVEPDLPEPWGLLAVNDRGIAEVIVSAPLHERRPWPWHMTIGVLRAAMDAGFNALQRAESRGFDRGHELGRTTAERESGGEAFRELSERVQAFEGATGIPVARWTSADRETFGWIKADDLADTLARVLRNERAVQESERLLADIASRLERAIAGCRGAFG